jgi:hypothetical protein
MGAAHIWDEWMHMVQSFAVSVPLMVGVGNHEYDHTRGGAGGKDPSGIAEDHGFMPEWGNFGDDSGGECGVPTSKRFTMPSSNNSNGVFWYSHDFANVHTIMLSSEHNLTEGSLQYEWFLEDLKSVNRSATPWLILELHRPLYQSEFFFTQNAVGVAMRYEIEELLMEYKVDLVLSGHYHSSCGHVTGYTIPNVTTVARCISALALLERTWILPCCILKNGQKFSFSRNGATEGSRSPMLPPCTTSSSRLEQTTTLTQELFEMMFG